MEISKTDRLVYHFYQVHIQYNKYYTVQSICSKFDMKGQLACTCHYSHQHRIYQHKSDKDSSLVGTFYNVDLGMAVAGN